MLMFLKRQYDVHFTLDSALLMNLNSSTSLGSWAVGCAGSQAVLGVWAGGASLFGGKRQSRWFARARAGVVAQVVGHSWQVHAPRPTLRSSGRANARRLP